MTKATFYFPVGQEQSTQQLKAYSWQDMQGRSLYDPRFSAPCNLRFDWRHYLEPRFNNKQFEKEVGTTLDQIASTPEGQHIIRQASAMQHYRIRSGQTDTPRSQTHKLIITDQMQMRASLFDSRMNRLIIHRLQVETVSTQGEDGRYYHVSLPHAVFHELTHAADGLSDTTAKRYRSEVKVDELYSALGALASKEEHDEDKKYAPLTAWNKKVRSIYEYPAIRATNEFMQKYYGEKPRSMRHDLMKENTFWNKLISATREQPLLPEGITYHSVPVTPVCKPQQAGTALGQR